MGRRIIVAGVVSMLVLTVTLSREFYNRTSADPFFSLTLAGFLFVFFSIARWPILDVLQLSATTLILACLQVLVLRIDFKALPAFALLGVAGFALQADRWLRSAREEKSSWYAFLPPFLLALAQYFGSSSLALTGKLHPKTLDLALYGFDQSLGLQLSCVIGRFVLRSRLLTKIAVGVYYVLPLPLMFVYARQLLRRKSLALNAFLAFLIAGPLGVVFYNLVPACGPIYLLGSRFPWQPLAVQQLGEPFMASVAAARNAFPSLHMSWALLIWWYSKGLSWWTRLGLFGFLVGTALAIMGVGEHYFVDLVAAFPMALMIESICSPQLPIQNRRRLSPWLTALGCLLGWVCLLRSGVQITSHIISWSLVLASISASLVLHARLQSAIFLTLESSELSSE